MAGNLFGLGTLRKVRLLDVIFPDSIHSHTLTLTLTLTMHQGPGFGIQDARKILGVFDRPPVGTIVKPKVELDPKGTAEVAAAAIRGATDLVNDDGTGP